MKQHLQNFRTGQIDAIDQERVAIISAQLPDTDAPAARNGDIVYLEGGLIPAVVAQEGAKIFNKTGFKGVVIVGAGRPWFDSRVRATFPYLRENKFPLPSPFASNADYLLGVFQEHAHSNMFDHHNTHGNIHVVRNDREKAERCTEIFNEAGQVLCVAPAWSLLRVMGTVMQACEPDVTVTGYGVYPFNTDRTNWHQNDITYALAMEDADQYGPLREAPATNAQVPGANLA